MGHQQLGQRARRPVLVNDCPSTSFQGHLHFLFSVIRISHQHHFRVIFTSFFHSLSINITHFPFSVRKLLNICYCAHTQAHEWWTNKACTWGHIPHAHWHTQTLEWKGACVNEVTSHTLTGTRRYTHTHTHTHTECKGMSDVRSHTHTSACPLKQKETKSVNVAVVYFYRSGTDTAQNMEHNKNPINNFQWMEGGLREHNQMYECRA